MKYEMHVQPSQFEFIGFSYDSKEEMTPEAITRAVDDYKRVKGMIDMEGSLPDKEWNVALDNYRSGKGMEAETHEAMSERQRWMIHEIDKSNARFERHKIIKEAQSAHKPLSTVEE